MHLVHCMCKAAVLPQSQFALEQFDQQNSEFTEAQVLHSLQDYLCRRADKHLIPKVDNPNVDRNVAPHMYIESCHPL